MSNKMRSEHSLQLMTLKCILTVFAIIVAVGPASAMCFPQPCVDIPNIPKIYQPRIPLNSASGTPAPQIQKFTLAASPVMAAPVQLYIAATPSPTQQLLDLRRQGAFLLDQIRFKGYQVSFEQLRTILSPTSPSSPDAENYASEARDLLGKYLIVLRDMEWIKLGIRIGSENYDQRIRQVEIVQGHIDAVNMDLNPLYSVYRSDATVHIEDPNTPRTANCRTTTVYESHIVNVTVSAGFDDRGNPIMRQRMDIERSPKEITVCD